MKLILRVLIAICIAATLEAAVKIEPVAYKAGNVTMNGYIAYDDAKDGKRPGVLVVHEWWGLNQYAQNRAKMLAELGYTALAVDMFGGGKQTTHPADAQKFTQEVMSSMDVAKSRFEAGLQTLKSHKTVDPERIAAIGYCFGGGLVLEMARQGVDLDAVVSFHGGVSTPNPAKPGAVKAKVMVAHGEADEFMKPEDLTKFEEEMKNAKVDYKIIRYPNAKHSFTNPEADEMAKKANIPIGYNAEADKKSWADMTQFLKEAFQS
jgi:dienelactone hydrolase